jgi:hypothetical protein
MRDTALMQMALGLTAPWCAFRSIVITDSVGS